MASKAEKEKVMIIDGVEMCQRPDGRMETVDERDKRLAHNARMRFNRSFDSPMTEYSHDD